MNSLRVQHLLPAILVLLLATTVTYLSFIREPASAFLFPRLVAVVMLSLAVWNFIRAARGLARVGNGISLDTLLKILPGLLVMVVYLFWAAKYFGFYLASFVAFFILFTLYDPASHKALRSWMVRLIVTLCFMLVIFCLFNLLLQVQTPRGIFL